MHNQPKSKALHDFIIRCKKVTYIFAESHNREWPFPPVALGTLWSDALFIKLRKCPAYSMATPNILQHQNSCSCRDIQREIGMLSGKKKKSIGANIIDHNNESETPAQQLNVIIHQSGRCGRTISATGSCSPRPTNHPLISHRSAARLAERPPPPHSCRSSDWQSQSEPWPLTRHRAHAERKPASVITWRIFHRRRLRRSLKYNSDWLRASPESEQPPLVDFNAFVALQPEFAASSAVRILSFI